MKLIIPSVLFMLSFAVHAQDAVRLTITKGDEFEVVEVDRAADGSYTYNATRQIGSKGFKNGTELTTIGLEFTITQTHEPKSERMEITLKNAEFVWRQLDWPVSDN